MSAPSQLAPPAPTATGPRTEHGRRVAARNATTHGLFARDVVLPHLGEDPEGYRALLHELTAQLNPRNLLEQHYAEKIAAASWRLRRLQRWQAQLFEDPAITEDEALTKLDRVMRHETALHRQIDTSVKMLGRELPRLFQDRVRAELIRDMNATERECREDPAMNEWITAQTRRRIPSTPVPPALDPTTLDAAPAPPTPPELGAGGRSAPPATRNCQKEPAPATPPPPVSGPLLAEPRQRGEEVARSSQTGLGEPEGVSEDRAWAGVPPEIVRHWTANAHTTTKCQNEPPSDSPRIGGRGAICSPIIGGRGASSPSPVFGGGQGGGRPGRVGASETRAARQKDGGQV